MSDKKGLIDCYLECVKDDSKKVEQFLRLLVEYTKEVNETVSKRIRAEVLAACANKAETTIYYREVDVLEWDAARLQQQIANDIRQLQPAASALEELLREEREKGYSEALEATQRTIAASGLDDDGVNHILSRIRSLRLEKARASEEKKKP